MTAATVRARGASLATRNSADFEGIGIKVINPWVLPARPLSAKAPVGPIGRKPDPAAAARGATLAAACFQTPGVPPDAALADPDRVVQADGVRDADPLTCRPAIAKWH